jgi:hypothetical protein
MSIIRNPRRLVLPGNPLIIAPTAAQIAAYAPPAEAAEEGELPTVTLSATDNSASEGGGTGAFMFTRDGDLVGDLEVFFVTSGTATPTTDYTALPASITIPDGEATYELTVTAAADALTDAAETVIATLSANAAYIVGSPSAGTVTITDTTPVVTVVANDNSASEGGGTGQFTFSRTGSTSGALTVNFTVSGTATSGVDFTGIGTSVVIGDGNADATVTVTALADVFTDAAETVIVTLAAGSYAIGSPSEATVTITDTTPVVTIALTSNGVEDGLPCIFDVTRTGSTAAPLDVYFTVTGTASPGDYEDATTSPVTIPIGETSIGINFYPIADAVMDDGETIIVTIDANAGYRVGSPSSDTATITDATTPLTIAAANGETIELWLDSAVGVTAPGNAVELWEDQSGDARHARQATAGNKPIYSATSFLGGPGIEWDTGNVRCLVLDSATPNAAYTLWYVFQPIAMTASRNMLRNSGNTHGCGVDSTLHPRILTGVTTAHATEVVTAGDPTFTKYAWTSGGDQRVFRQGGTETTVNPAGTVSAAMDQLGATSNSMRGIFAEIIMISGNHAEGSDVATQMAAYIAAKYPTI